MGSHTLVVHREQAAPYRGGREPFLQRWLFSPRLAIIALVVVLGAGLGLGGWWFTSGRYTQVPSVTGDSVAAATTALTTHGFKVTQGARVHSNTVPEGTVMGTNPSGRVAKGSTIAILISAGPFTSVVPKVQGGTLSAAEAALQRVHLSYSVQKTGSDAPAGTVLGTSPGAGTTWPQTKPVAILVSEGVSVPNFVGTTLQAVQQWAGQHGANLQQQPDQASQQQPGTITGSAAGARIAVHPGRDHHGPGGPAAHHGRRPRPGRPDAAAGDSAAAVRRLPGLGGPHRPGEPGVVLQPPPGRSRPAPPLTSSSASDIAL